MLFWITLFLLGLALAKFSASRFEQEQKKSKLNKIQKRLAQLEAKEIEDAKQDAEN
jgi:uncharacterized protein YgfB (UPF0149 family)